MKFDLPILLFLLDVCHDNAIAGLLVTPLMATNSGMAAQQSRTDLNFIKAAEMLLQETSPGESFTTKTGIKSIDVHFPDLFSSGKVVGLGQTRDDDASVCIV